MEESEQPPKILFTHQTEKNVIDGSTIEKENYGR